MKVDEALKHGICCTIGLKSSIISFDYGKVQYMDNTNIIQYFSYQPAFIFDGETNTVVRQGEDAIKKRKCIESNQIYIGNILETIESLYKSHKDQKIDDFSKNLSFVAVAKYFEENLAEQCKRINIRLNQLLVVLILPNRFALEPEALDVMFGPLFVKAGVIHPSDHESGRITLLTNLESLFVGYQLNDYHEGRSKASFLRRENQCFVYSINVDDELTQWEVAHIQLKEDYTASLFQQRFYTPKFISIRQNQNLAVIDSTSVKKTLTDFVMTQLLNFDKCTTYETDTIDRIVLCVLFHVCESDICRKIMRYYHRDESDRQESDDRFLKEHLTDEQTSRIKSDSFLENVLQLLSNMLSDSLDKTVSYIRSAHTIRSQVSKSLVVNGYLKSNHTFNYCLYHIFFYLLQKSLDSFYNVYTNLIVYRPILNGLYLTEFDLHDGARLVCRRLMVSNIKQSPLIMDKQLTCSELKLNKPMETQSKLGYIVHLDISFDSTTINCTRVDNDGLINDSSNVYLLQNVQSLRAFLDSEMIGATTSLPDDRQGNKHKDPLTPRGSQLAVISTKILNLLNYCSSRKRLINMSTVGELSRKYFLEYLKKILDRVVNQLGNTQIDTNRVGYAVCLEKAITNNLQLMSREEVLEFVEKNDLVPPTSPIKDIVLVDQGDQLVWQMLGKNRLEPFSYYVHSHISDDYIYLKLYQIIDSNEPNRKQSALFIQEKFLNMKNVYEEVAERICTYIQLFANEGIPQNCDNRRLFLCTEDFRLCKGKLIRFIKEELCSESYQHREACISIDTKHNNVNSANDTIIISVQELIEIAIIPVLKEVVGIIVASLLNRDIFGHYDIAKLFLTGHFLRVKNYNQGYQYMIETELRKTLEHALLHKSHMTTFDISITTCQERPSENLESMFKQKHFCYDKLIWGELRTVANSVYLLRKDFVFQSNQYLISVGINGTATTYGHSSVMFSRGDCFAKKRFKLDVFYDERAVGRKMAFILEIYDLGDPDGIQKSTSIRAPGYVRVRTNTNIPATIQVEYLHYSSCIKFSSDYYNYDENGALNLETDSFRMIERQVVKYF